MHMLIRYFDGRAVRGMLLAAHGNTMRVAIPGCDDSTEFVLRAGIWISETNEAVEIQFIAPAAEDEWSRFCDVLASSDALVHAEPPMFASRPASPAGSRQLVN